VARFDMLIGDEANIPKLAQLLLHRLISLSRAFRFRILAGNVLCIDKDAINLLRILDFTVQDINVEGTVQALLRL
jgi:hypothetical protein